MTQAFLLMQSMCQEVRLFSRVLLSKVMLIRHLLRAGAVMDSAIKNMSPFADTNDVLQDNLPVAFAVFASAQIGIKPKAIIAVLVSLIADRSCMGEQKNDGTYMEVMRGHLLDAAD